MRHDEPNPGDLIAGKYRVRAILGRGRGTLVLAEHVAFEQRVAIRIVSPALSDPVEVAKFRREARVLAKLGSEHVARVLDVGVLIDGSLYLVRQYLEGADLTTYLRERRTLPVEEAIGWILQATEAVAETHAYGILVRELAPEHLFLADRSPGVRGGPRVLKITDFGTAKLLRERQPGAAEDYTATTVLGLSPYSSPEMLRRQKDLDVRTDVWSLAAILYEMLSGQAPFGNDMVSLAVAITRDEAIPLARFRRDVPPEVEAAIRNALAKDKNARPADTHAFAASLIRYAPPEARGLMQRIRDLAGSARARMGGAEPEEEELDVDEVDVIEDSTTGDLEDAETRVGPIADLGRKAPSTAPAARAPRRSVTQEKTEALGFNFIPSDPIAPGNHAFAGAAAGLEPPPHQPTQMLPAVSAPSSPGGSNPPRTTPPPGPPPPSMPMIAPATPMPSPSASAPSQPLGPAWMTSASAPALVVQAGQRAQVNNGRKVAMFAVGGALAALLILVVVVIALPGRAPQASASGSAAATATAAEREGAAKPSAEASASAQADVSAPPPLLASASETAVVSAVEPSSASAVAVGSTKPKASATVASGTTSTAATTSKPTATSPQPTATAEPPKGGDGTLVVVAVGGTCAFTVNGQAKGTTNSLKLVVPPGPYNVSCKPSSGASKSKAVTVKSGSTAMAMFKLN